MSKLTTDADRELVRTIAAKAVFGNDSSNTLCSSAACRNASHGSKEHTCDVCRIELLILAALAKRDAERQPVELSAKDAKVIELLALAWAQINEPELWKARQVFCDALNALLREKRSGK